MRSDNTTTDYYIVYNGTNKTILLQLITLTSIIFIIKDDAEGIYN